MTIPIRTPTKTTWNVFSPHFAQEKTSPNSPERIARSSALSMSRTWEVSRSCMDPRKSRSGPPRNPFRHAQISSIKIPQSTKDGIVKMLIRTLNHGQLRQSRPIPTKPTQTPMKTKTKTLSNQKVHRPMTRGSTTDQLQKPTNPSSLKRPVSKIPPHQPEPLPHNTCQASYQYAPKSTYWTNKLEQKQPST